MPASIWDMWQQERSREGQPKGARTLHDHPGKLQPSVAWLDRKALGWFENHRVNRQNYVHPWDCVSVSVPTTRLLKLLWKACSFGQASGARSNSYRTCCDRRTPCRCPASGVTRGAWCGSGLWNGLLSAAAWLSRRLLQCPKRCVSALGLLLFVPPTRSFCSILR